MTWTTTYPNLRLAVWPTKGVLVKVTGKGKVKLPPGYVLRGTAVGTSNVSVRLIRKGAYENCDWNATYQPKTRIRIYGEPWDPMAFYMLTVLETFLDYDQPTPYDECQANELRTNVNLIDPSTPRLLFDVGNARSLVDSLQQLFMKPQPRNQLSRPLNALCLGRNLTLRLTRLLEVNDYVDRGTAKATITFARKT